MSNYMITQEEIEKERFSNQEIKLDGSVKAFLNYFVSILIFAQNLEIISDERRNAIFSNIAMALESKSKNNIIITNIMYVFSAWLMSMDLYSAWKELDSIKDLNSAVESLEKSKNWYKHQILEMKTNLLCSEKSVKKIDNENLKRAYVKLFDLLKVIDKYDESYQFSFKNEHITRSVLSSINYCFITSRLTKESSVIQALKCVYYDFFIELRIFTKLNGKEFVVFSNEEYTKSEAEKSVAELELNEKYEALLKKAEEEYKEELAEARKFDIKFEKMLKEEQEKVPLEEFEHNDVVRIEKKYRAKRDKINKEWDLAEEALNKKLDRIRDLEGSLAFQSDMPSLLFAMQEFALWSQAKKGMIVYPENRVQKGILLENMPLSKVISEVLENAEAIGLCDSEIEYLKKNM